MRVGKITFVHFLSQIVVSVAGFLATFLIARLLGAGPLGIYSVSVAVGFFWLTIPASAVGSAIIKRVSEGGDRAASMSAGVLLNLSILLLTVVLVLSFDGIINRYVGAEVSDLIALLVAGSISFKTMMTGLSGQKK